MHLNVINRNKFNKPSDNNFDNRHGFRIKINTTWTWLGLKKTWIIDNDR